MRAILYDRYGPPDVLRIEDVSKPSPTGRQVLVKIAATSVNLSDWETLRGSPLYSRIESPGEWASNLPYVAGADHARRMDVSLGYLRDAPCWSMSGGQLTLSVGQHPGSFDFVVALPTAPLSEIRAKLVGR